MTFERPEDVIGVLYRMKDAIQVEQVPGEAFWVATQAKILPREAA
jgi:hypothetical protein